MKKAFIAVALAGLLATPAFAQTSGTMRQSDSASQSREGQYGPSGNRAQQFGTDDQKMAPNAACPPGSTNPECQQERIQDSNPPATGNNMSGAMNNSMDRNRSQ